MTCIKPDSKINAKTTLDSKNSNNNRRRGNKSDKRTSQCCTTHSPIFIHTGTPSRQYTHTQTQTHVSSALYSCLRCVCDTAPQLSRQRKLFAALAFSHVHQCVSVCVCVYWREKCHLAKVVVVAVVAASAAIASTSKSAASSANYGN